MKRFEVLTAVAALIAACLAGPAAAQKVYWSNAPDVQRADASGANVETISLGVSGVDLPTGIAVAGNQVYWIDATSGVAIRRADTDGANPGVVISFSDSVPLGIAVDADGGKLYWSDRPSGVGRINRANLADGSNVESFSVGGRPISLALDLAAGRIYWTDNAASFNGAIRGADLTGGNQADVITSDLVNPAGLALDAGAGKLYWADIGGKIERADLDGSNREVLVNTLDGIGEPQGIALDACSGTMFWSDRALDRIQRSGMAFLTGESAGTRSDIQNIVLGVVNVSFLAADGAGGAPPVLTIPPDITVACDAPADPGATGTPSAQGTEPITLTFADDAQLGACDGTGTITRTWTADDACGNSASGVQLIAVEDTAAPALDGVPADATAGCADVPDPAAVTASDACDPAPEVTFGEALAAGPCADTFTLTRTWNAEDGCGNAAVATQVVSVEDHTAPLLASVPASAVVECDAVPAAAAPAAVDDCDPAPIIAFAETVLAGDCDQASTRTRSWTATDRCGNATSASQVLTVQDTTAPVIGAAPAVEVIDSDCSGTEAVALPGATDNCDPAVDVSGPAVFEAGSTTTAQYLATDDCGNTAALSSDVAVRYGAALEIHAHALSFGWGNHPPVTREPIAGMDVHVFFEPEEFCVRELWWAGWHWWRHVLNDCLDAPLVNSGVTGTDGIVTLDVPPGDHLIIGTLDTDDDGEPDEFFGGTVSNLQCGESQRSRLRLIITPRGKRLAAKIARFEGSELLIVEPDLMIWDDEEQEYPYGLESDGEWGVTVSIAPPEGFVTDQSQLTETVEGQDLEALQFTVTEVGSDLVPTLTTFDITHNGQRMVHPSQVGLLLTPDYARQRGFDVHRLRTEGLIFDRGLPARKDAAAPQRGGRH